MEEKIKKCLDYMGIKELPPVWDEKTPFDTAVGKVERIGGSESWAIVRYFGRDKQRNPIFGVKKDFDKSISGIKKVIEVYPQQAPKIKKKKVIHGFSDLETLEEARRFLDTFGVKPEDIAGKNKEQLEPLVNSVFEKSKATEDKHEKIETSAEPDETEEKKEIQTEKKAPVKKIKKVNTITTEGVSVEAKKINIKEKTNATKTK